MEETDKKQQDSRPAGGIPGMSFNAPVTFNAPMFDIHDNTNVYINAGEKSDEGGRKEDEGKGRPCPAAGRADMFPPDAPRLFDKLVQAGMLDADYRPVGLSGAEKGVLANLLATRLGIKNLWQAFGELWGIKPETLRTANTKAQSQLKTSRFMDEIKRIIDN
ncbi:MAG: hypothetical protein J6K31_04515 [Parabacteroides sp.]|nr:hypothetical protein [Parabacteroides sp.]